MKPRVQETAPPDVSARESRWRGAVLLVALIAAAGAYSFRLMSFLHAKELALAAALACLAIIALAEGRTPRGGFRAFAPLWLLITGSLLVHAVLGRAVLPNESALTLCRFALVLLAPGLTYDLLSVPAWQNRVRGAIAGSGALVAGLALLQYAGAVPWLFPEVAGYPQRAYSVFGNQDLLGGYAAITLPLALHRWFAAPRSIRWGGASGLLLAALLVSGSRSGWAAGGIGLVMVLCEWRRHRFTWRRTAVVLGVVAAAVVLLAPAATVDRLRQSFTSSDTGYRVRLWVWDGTLRMVRANPLVGVGPGNFAYWSPRYLGDALRRGGGESHLHNEVHTLHAHSDPLELAAETGVLGVALAAWMLFRLRRSPIPERAALAALVTFSLANFPLHSAPHALVGALCAGISLACGSPATAAGVPSRPPTTGLAGRAIPIGCLLLAGFHTWALVLPSYLYRSAMRAEQAGEASLPLYERAWAHPWPHPLWAARYGYALAETGELERASSVLSSLEGKIDTGEYHLVRGALAVKQGSPAAARRFLEACVERWPANEQAWRLLVRVSPADSVDAHLRAAERWLPPAAVERVRTEAFPPTHPAAGDG